MKREQTDLIIHFPFSVFHFLDGCFFDDHHRDVVFDGIDKRAFGVRAFESAPVRIEFNHGLAFRTAEDFEEFWI